MLWFDMVEGLVWFDMVGFEVWYGMLWYALIWLVGFEVLVWFALDLLSLFLGILKRFRTLRRGRKKGE